MKLKMYFMLMAIGLLGFSLQSCDDDDDNIKVPAELQNALYNKYPTAQWVEWETEGSYYVADFYYNNWEAEAWFTRDGIWQMTETDLPFNDLPSAVRNAFQNSAYAQWRVDDVDMLERTGLEVFYVIEVESGNMETDLHYSQDGILLKELTDGGGNSYWPPVQPDNSVMNSVRDFINEHYANARIIEIDREQGNIEVDIIHENRNKDVTFDTQGNWLSTSWDLFYNELPQAVSQAVQTAYPGYRLDDADYVETPAGSYYLVELENGGPDIYVRVTENGEILE